MSENPLKVQIDYTKHNRTLFSCSRKEFLLDEDKWSKVADEEGWASVVNVQNEYGDHIVKLEADDCGGINLNLDLYKDEIEALKDKYLILKGECWGGGNSKEEDAKIHGDDGEFSEVGDLNFKPSTVRLGLIEDIVNEAIVGDHDEAPVNIKLDELDISESFFQQVEIVLIEGYLWSSPSARKAITKVINIAHKKKIKVMFSLSNHNLVELFRKDFLELVENHVDILIGNELEFFEMFKSKDDKIILSEMKDKIDVGIMTKGEKGAMIFENNCTLEVKPLVVENVIDTTGAGDMFAAGFLSKIIDGKNALEAANFGCKVAARIITQYGARPSKELIGDLTRDEN